MLFAAMDTNYTRMDYLCNTRMEALGEKKLPWRQRARVGEADQVLPTMGAIKAATM